jgi:hypothetical protein
VRISKRPCVNSRYSHRPCACIIKLNLIKKNVEVIVVDTAQPLYHQLVGIVWALDLCSEIVKDCIRLEKDIEGSV